MPTVIHPTAIIHPRAEIGEDCQVGPYCLIGERVRLGPRGHLHSHVVLDGNTAIGADCEIFPFACIGKRTQDLKYHGGDGRLEIGDHNTFREGVTVHLPTAPDGLTRIGSHCSLLAYCHVAHECRLGDGVVMSNATQIAGHVEIGDRAVFGGLCGVHQFCRIGRLVMVGALSKVTQDMPPFLLAEGDPATPRTVNKVGIRRGGFTDEQIDGVAQAFRILYRSGLRVEEAVRQLRADFMGRPEIAEFATFVETSSRGVARPAAAT
ncbi:MAG: Acyl-(acyl-carrier-protein)--UDP-N-acetylglucosamine O-acyltransferase [Lentisphaerae bacterium ADurb.BinA184]|nr:MAG: Acyl-(acyl-carrier-protein)--UDP-N-acetylglucosamine O-acyltransferase [Lentisphaerae bacterium ADurb.BinA184]